MLICGIYLLKIHNIRTSLQPLHFFCTERCSFQSRFFVSCCATTVMCLMHCSMLTEAGILPHLASHVAYDAKKLDILTEVCWVLTYLTAWYIWLLYFVSLYIYGKRNDFYNVLSYFIMSSYMHLTDLWSVISDNETVVVYNLYSSTAWLCRCSLYQIN